MDLERGSVIVCVSNGDYGKPRPAVVVQSNLFNATHASITVCPITTHIIEAPLFRLLISPSQENGLKQISQVMIDKITSIHVAEFGFELKSCWQTFIFARNRASI
jgi:mRNA interferase MazF